MGGNLNQRPRCPYYRHPSVSCFKKGGSVCLAEFGFNKYAAIFGGGPSYYSHPSDLATALVMLGATASIEVDGKPQRRSVKPGYSYCSSSDPAVHFGLGAQTAPLEVEVRWADGELETFGPVPLGARSSLVRGLGR